LFFINSWYFWWWNCVHVTNIEYITLASQGNGISFGSLSLGKEYGSGLSSSSRGIFGAGQSAPVQALTNVIDYVTISTLGNALDFGDLINAMSYCLLVPQALVVFLVVDLIQCKM
jgi:hypothetical protein